MTTVIDYSSPASWRNTGHEAQPGVPFVEQAKDLGLDWSIKERPVMIDLGEKKRKVMASWKGLMRSDTQEVLNVTKKRYRPVQPAHILAFFDSLRSEHNLTMETVGVLNGGRIIWGLAATGRDLSFTDEDKVKEYVLAASSADYSFSTTVKRTSVRVVCQNTLAMALREASKDSISRSHAGAFNFDRARDIILHIQQEPAEALAFQEQMKDLALTKVTDDEAVAYFTRVFFPGKKVEDVREHKRSSNHLDEIMTAFREAPGQQIDTAKGTAWGLVNAVTYLSDHLIGKTDEARVKASFFAEGAVLKARAMQTALKLVA